MEQVASGNEIQKAVHAWWHYVEKKVSLQPYLAAGIAHKLIHHDRYHNHIEPDKSPTVRYSLAPNISPELSLLGNLVETMMPHVYVEGIRNAKSNIPFDEIYTHKREEIILQSDPDNTFPKYLQINKIDPDRFYLHISATNELLYYGAEEKNIRFCDILIFTDIKNKFLAFTLQGGFQSVRIKPFKRYFGSFYFVHENKMKIEQASQQKIALVQYGFQQAIEKIEKLRLASDKYEK